MKMLKHWDEMAVEPRGPTVTKRHVDGLGAGLVRLDIKAGTVAARHSHAFEQFVQVINGRGTLETEDGRHPFSAGSLFHFAAGAWHAAEFDEDTVLVETNLKA